MARNPHARRCSSPGCRAFAVRASEPPLCSAHGRRNLGAGAPAGNQNRTTHGLYSQALQLCDMAGQVARGDLALQGEIGAARLALRRMLALLDRAEQRLTVDETLGTSSLALSALRSLAHLLRERRALAGEAADGLCEALARALDELNAIWWAQL